MSKLPRVQSLNGDRKLINACRKAGLPLHNPIIGYNRIGYNRYGAEYGYKSVTLSTIGDVRKYNKIYKEIKNIPEKSVKSYAEKKEEWCKRLVKLTEITIEEAREIARDKADYQEEQISELEDRQSEHYSRKREMLINKIRRSNPLRYIKDSEHAQNILTASHRHKNTDYESRLEEGKELSQIGNIDRSEVRDYARKIL